MEPEIITNERGDVAVARRGVDQRIADLAAGRPVAEADPPDFEGEEQLVRHAVMRDYDARVDAELEDDDRRRDQMNAELQALRECELALIAADAESRPRIVRWLIEKYGSLAMKAALYG